MEELIQQCLKNHKKKQIELKRIEQYVIEKLGQDEYLRRGGYKAFANAVNSLVGDKLKPIKARKINQARVSHLYNWYRIIHEHEGWTKKQKEN